MNTPEKTIALKPQFQNHVAEVRKTMFAKDISDDEIKVASKMFGFTEQQIREFRRLTGLDKKKE